MDTKIKNVLPRWKSPQLYQDTEGISIAEFVEDYLVNPTASFGAEQFSPVELREWQLDLLDDLFEIAPNGYRRYRQGLIGLPKKNGKSFLASAIALYELVTGDANSLIVLCAAAKDQTKNVFDPAKQMVEASPLLSTFLKCEQKAIINTQTGSVLRVVAADAATQDGLKPKLVIFDEVHRQPNNSELWDVMTKGIATTPNAMVIGFTTAGSDRESLCYLKYEYGKKLATGEIPVADDPSFFFRWWEPQDEEADINDPEVWQECNPGLDDFLSLEDIKAESTRSPENSFRRFNLNQFTKTASAWLKFGAWDNCYKADRHLQPGERVVLGFDGSQTGDWTAVVAVSLDDLHIEVLELWNPDELASDHVPVEEVENTIRQACKTYSVAMVVADPAYWTRSLGILAGEGIPVEHFSFSSTTKTTEATKIMQDLVYEKKLSHNGDVHLASHVGNCVVKTNRMTDSLYITKEYKNSSRRIDIAVATLIALWWASNHRDANQKLTNLAVLI